MGKLAKFRLEIFSNAKPQEPINPTLGAIRRLVLEWSRPHWCSLQEE
jgi:hypothetical protein